MAERLTESKVDALMSKHKVIREVMEWQKLLQRDERKKIKVHVEVENAPVDELLFIAEQNKAKEIAFNLVIGERNAQCLRRFDKAPHKNPGEWAIIDKPHKHKWTDKYQCHWAYLPNPSIDVTNVEKGIRQFLDECGIKYEGEIIDRGRIFLQRTVDPSFEHLQYEDEDSAEAMDLIEGGDDDS